MKGAVVADFIADRELLTWASAAESLLDNEQKMVPANYVNGRIITLKSERILIGR